MSGTKIALTLAGSDSSGGAGIQADLKTFSAFGVYGASVITALTAQNTHGVTGVLATPANMITAQIDAVAGDLRIGAVKTGMLGTREAVMTVCEGIRRHGLAPLVVDPVMVATSGDVLLDADAIEAVRSALIPLAALVTPNLAEAARLLDEAEAATTADMARQARAISERFAAKAVLIKGGHGAGETAVDVLFFEGRIVEFALPRFETIHTHGTGCTLSAAICALLALGEPLDTAVRRAKEYVWQALSAGRDLGVGSGCGPVDHLFAIRKAGFPV